MYVRIYVSMYVSMYLCAQLCIYVSKYRIRRPFGSLGLWTVASGGCFEQLLWNPEKVLFQGQNGPSRQLTGAAREGITTPAVRPLAC